MAPVLPVLASDSSVGHIVALKLSYITPTSTWPDAVSKVISARQQGTTTTVIAESNGDSTHTLSGGAIAGIVVGSIAGFLLLLWIIRSCINYRNPGGWGESFEPEFEKSPSRHHHSSTRYPREIHDHRSHSRHSHRSPRRTSVVSVTRPVYVEQHRSRSPRAPPTVYHSDGRDYRRSSDARRYSRASSRGH
ncbi:uncharacterized protein GGS25DRAFT_455433 [Hypoxylon fragiforme]|uniref:uncharacterized protein n=1 Tax=Hypoxylon fragiforme TaxID=63214 RepID=UPI0020C73897|nr:uncharacterized protein GGS25DRAFT_455433 [Hypoxylon fragiforme]KAI2604313.1 hypothetical protein GGS25DRAFT_455433 [Hypoxylon fragiforme]